MGNSMPRKTSKLTEDTAWLRDFAAILNKPDEKLPPGKGWVEMSGLLKACGRPRITSTFKKKTTELVRSGLLEMHSGTRFDEKRKKLVRRVSYRWNAKAGRPSK